MLFYLLLLHLNALRWLWQPSVLN